MKKKNMKVNGGKLAVAANKEKFAKLKANVVKNKDRLIALGLTVVVVGGSVIFYFVNKNANKGNSNTSIIETNKEEEYSRELLEIRVKTFAAEAEKIGIEVTEEEILEFAALMNIDKIVSEDPELANQLFAGKNAQDILSNAGHMIGKLMTNSFTGNYQNPMNLSTLVVGNDYDKAILARLESYRDELTTMRAEEKGEHRKEFATEEETKKFNQMITDVLNFYSMTADGLEISGENFVIQPMGDGNRFAMVLVMNEIALGNRNLLTDAEYKAFEQLMSNEPAVANLHRIIEGCQTEKSLTK